jgi:hypothetical protein
VLRACARKAFRELNKPAGGVGQTEKSKKQQKGEKEHRGATTKFLVNKERQVLEANQVRLGVRAEFWP